MEVSILLHPVSSLLCLRRSDTHEARRRQRQRPAAPDFVTEGPARHRLFHRLTDGDADRAWGPHGEARPANGGGGIDASGSTMSSREFWVSGVMKRDEEPLARGLAARRRLPRAARRGGCRQVTSRGLDGSIGAIAPRPVQQFSICRAKGSTHPTARRHEPTATDVSAGVGAGFALIRPDILAPLKRANPVKAGDAKSTV